MLGRLLLSAIFIAALAGCDQLGIESATVTAARVEADGKAVGAACRHGGRAIEDCFALNRKTDKSAIYAGWREMDDYMRENKIEPVQPTLATAAVARKPAEAEDAADETPKPAPADKAAKADKASHAKPEKAAAAEPEKAPAAH
jgi:hypothetical protein